MGHLLGGPGLGRRPLVADDDFRVRPDEGQARALGAGQIGRGGQAVAQLALRRVGAETQEMSGESGRSLLAIDQVERVAV